MNRELINRILTSLALLPILFICIYYGEIYLITFLGLIFSFCMYEILKVSKKILFNLTANIVIIFSLFSFFFLRGETNYSLIIIYWILTSTFLSDIGGYTFGKSLKGKKLTRISPNKTYSGSIGSIIFCLISLPLLNCLQEFFLNENLINFFKLKYFVLTICISIICQLGDIYVSHWKRKFNIKNTSNLLPGHGGVLDRIDGLIFVLIFSFIVKIIGLI